MRRGGLSRRDFFSANDSQARQQHGRTARRVGGQHLERRPAACNGQMSMTPLTRRELREFRGHGTRFVANPGGTQGFWGLGYSYSPVALARTRQKSGRGHRVANRQEGPAIFTTQRQDIALARAHQPGPAAHTHGPCPTMPRPAAYAPATRQGTSRRLRTAQPSSKSSNGQTQQLGRIRGHRPRCLESPGGTRRLSGAASAHAGQLGAARPMHRAT